MHTTLPTTTWTSHYYLHTLQFNSHTATCTSMDNNDDPISRRRRLANERKARWRARQSQESLNLIRAADAVTHRRRRRPETPEQSQARRHVDAEAHRLAQLRHSQAVRDQAIHFVEAAVQPHNCGPMNVICDYLSEDPNDIRYLIFHPNSCMTSLRLACHHMHCCSKRVLSSLCYEILILNKDYVTVLA